MQPLFDAIEALFESSCEGKLYNTEALGDAKFPYTVLQLVNGGTTDFASNKAFTENMLFQFNIFDKSLSMSKVLEIYAALKAAFDFATLAVEGTTPLSCVRENTLSTRDEGVWQLNVTYRIKLRP